MKKFLWISSIILAILTFTYALVRIIIEGGNPLGIDATIRDWCYEIRGEKGGFLYWLFYIISEFGYVRIIPIIFVLVLILTKCSNKTICFAFGIVLSLALVEALRVGIGRPRPYLEYRWGKEVSKSFPSGHSSSATITYGFIAYFIKDTKLKTWIKNIIMSLCMIIIPCVMFSRLILGMHFFTDVISGLSIGFLCLSLAIILYEFMKRRNILNEGIIFKKRSNEKNNINN